MTKDLGNTWRQKLANIGAKDDLNGYIRPANDDADKEASSFLQECRKDMPDMIDAALRRNDDHICIQIKPFWVHTPSYDAFVGWLSEESIEIGAMGVEPASGDLVMTIYPG